MVGYDDAGLSEGAEVVGDGVVGLLVDGPRVGENVAPGRVGVVVVGASVGWVVVGGSVGAVVVGLRVGLREGSDVVGVKVGNGEGYQVGCTVVGPAVVGAGLGAEDGNCVQFNSSALQPTESSSVLFESLSSSTF